MHAILSEKRFPFCCSECADCCPLSVRPSRRRPSRPVVVVVVRRLSVRRVVVCPSSSFCRPYRRRPSSVRPSRRVVSRRRRRRSLSDRLSRRPSRHRRPSYVLCPYPCCCAFSVRPSRRPFVCFFLHVVDHTIYLVVIYIIIYIYCLRRIEPIGFPTHATTTGSQVHGLFFSLSFESITTH